MLNWLETSAFALKNKTPKDDYSIIIGKCTLINKKKTWYAKTSPNPFHVLAEVLSQEFFRALMPYQPKSLFVKTSQKQEFHIYSEQIPKYQTLQSCITSNIDLKSCKGLGKLLISALFLMENDMHDENIGINNKNQFVKIDGGECLRFATDTHQKMKLTMDVLQQLPFLNLAQYKISNWLDIICLGHSQENQSIFKQQPLDKNKFQLELSKGLLNICLLPPSFMQALCYKCLSKSPTSEKLLVILIERQEALKKIAKEGGYFKKTNFDSVAILNFKKHLLDFKLQETMPVLDENQKPIFEKEFSAAIYDLKPKPRISMFEQSTKLFDIPKVLQHPLKF